MSSQRMGTNNKIVNLMGVELGKQISEVLVHLLQFHSKQDNEG